MRLGIRARRLVERTAHAFDVHAKMLERLFLRPLPDQRFILRIEPVDQQIPRALRRRLAMIIVSDRKRRRLRNS
jgi:hypothetical protein